MASHINTDEFSQSLRERSINLTTRRILVSNIRGTKQENDLSEPLNCRGFGRIHHFRRETNTGWPPNPLPIDPACKALNLASTDLLRCQVFQNASCNWRCWYCYVPFSLLDADESRSSWLSAAELVDLYLAEPSPPPVIDLSGGQPDLVPEWVPWIMEELARRRLDSKVYLWSDDNLSNDYFWRFLSKRDRETVASYRNYGKVACFKGFNADSFAFNTRAAPELFERQFDLMRQYVELGIDIYGYVTLTSPSPEAIRYDMARFLDRLQEIHPNLPLRIIPLEIRAFNPVSERMKEVHRQAIQHQDLAVAEWQKELHRRFAEQDRSRVITEVPLMSR